MKELLEVIDRIERFVSSSASIISREEAICNALRDHIIKSEKKLHRFKRMLSNVEDYSAKIKMLLMGHSIALLEEDFDELKAIDADALIIDEIVVPVVYQFHLGGYKWREVLDVSLYDNIDKVHAKIDEACPAIFGSPKIFISETDLDGIEVDYTESKVDIDTSEAGSGVYHKEQCAIRVLLCMLKNDLV